MSIPVHYADRIQNIVVTGPLIRLEFGVVSGATPAAGDTPAHTASHTVVMPLQGFLASLKLQEALLKKLVDEGVLKPQSAHVTPPLAS